MNRTAVGIRRLGDGQLYRLQPMFERVFGHPVSLDLLRWKYTGGRGESWIAAMPGEAEPLLHCGLMFRDVLVAGQRCRAAQLVDLMAGAKRFGLSRDRSPFSLLMHSLLDGLVRPDNPSALAFGFPSDRAMRLGEHAGVYRAVDQWWALEFRPASRPLGPRLRPWHHASTADRSLAERLCQHMMESFSQDVLAVRDTDFLKWRYIEHPEKRYTIWLIESRWRRIPIGLAVVGPGSGQYEILDLIGRREDLPDMVAALQHWLHAARGDTLVFHLTERFTPQLSAVARSCAKTQFRIMANPYSPESLLATLRNGWWLTGGDTDYR